MISGTFMSKDKNRPDDDELTYAKSGVDIDAADRAIEKAKKMIHKTFTAGVGTDIGGFAGFFRPNLDNIKKPVLVSSTDGVGTKLLIARAINRLDTIGIDLVAMIVNDIICTGAKPLFLLDYIAIDKFDESMFTALIKGIVDGCCDAECALVGGETAELPGVYPPGGFDLAAFGVGIIDESKIINGQNIREGDSIIGLLSTGFHSNGYSLVRRIVFEKSPYQYIDRVPELGTTLGEALLKPTKIYVKAILSLIQNEIEICGIANITGGGLLGNVPRILPEGLAARIDPLSWETPLEMKLISEWGKVPYNERYRVFNMGIGTVLIMRGGQVDGALELLTKAGIKSAIIGEIVGGKREVILTS
jgi:phosphoribosylformylglycinamidine cyclo-ligase